MGSNSIFLVWELYAQTCSPTSNVPMACSPCCVATRVLGPKLSAHPPALSASEAALSSASESAPSAASPASLAAPLNMAPAPSITPAVTPPTSAAWATPSMSGLPLMALLAICPAPLARAPTAILATGPASGPASPDPAPETAPTTADCAISPNEVGLPCTALETTVVATLIAAPITAPRIIVHSGQQCPLGSLRVSGLSPT